MVGVALVRFRVISWIVRLGFDEQKELALANYKKVVELDPQNANALLIARRLEGKETKIDTSGFDAYVGEYEVNPRLTLTITKEGDKLFGQLTGQAKLAVEPVSDTQFTIPEVKASRLALGTRAPSPA